MKYACSLILRTSAIFALSVFASTAYSQVVKKSEVIPTETVKEQPAKETTAATAVEKDTIVPDEVEELVVLTPFEVSGSKDIGYQATDTLGGTRIRTDLRDVGSSISVATKEFMSDVGATDSQSLLQFMGNAEVGGSKGNFLIGSSVGDGSVIDEASALLRPQSNTRVRGLTAADNTRDYFLTDIPWDGYNVSRVDLLRGPNSILFGNGSPAGIINGTTDAASFGSTSTTIDLRTSSYGSYRASVNHNQVLLKNELAFRFAALNDKKFYQQKPAYNHDKRLYGALRYEPRFLKTDSARTSIKMSFERGDIDANRPRMTTINDGVSPWFLTAPVELHSPTPVNASGRTLLGIMEPMVSHAGYDPFVTNISGTSLATLLTANAALPANLRRSDIGARQPKSTANQNAEGWLGAQIKPNDAGGGQTGNGIDNGGLNFWLAMYDDPNSSSVSRYIFPSLNNATQYSISNTTGLPDGGTITGLRGPDLAGILRLDQYAFRGVGSFLYTLQGVWRSKTITDPSFFDFYKKLMDGPNKSERSKFDVFSASLEQTFLDDKVGFQLSYDRQAYADYRRTNLSNPTLRLDIYRYLPVATLNGTTGLYEPVLNPNFGRPFVVSKPSAARSRTKRDVGRFTPYGILDFSELLKSDNLFVKILGRHSFSGLYEVNRYERTTSSWIPYAVDGAQANAIFRNGGRVNGEFRSIGTVTYLGDSLLGASSMSGANLSRISSVEQPGGTTANAWYFDSNWTGGLNYNTLYAPPAIGLAPNQVGASPTIRESENPLNYAGWGSAPRTINVSSADAIGERDLTTSYTRFKTKTTSMALADQWSMLDRHVVVTAGIRKDKVETYYPGDPSYDATDSRRVGTRLTNATTGVVDWNLPFTYAGAPTSSYTSDLLKTYGIVVHAPDYISKRLPWGLKPSLFFSHSENFQPAIRRDPINGSSLTPPMGRTQEVGIALASANRKFSIKLNWYETKVKNASMPDNGVINFTADEIVQSLRVAKRVLYVRDYINTLGNPVPSSTNGAFYRPTANSNGSSTNLDPTGTHWYPWQPSRTLLSGQSWTLQEWRDAETHAVATANAFLDSINNPAAQQFMNLWQIKPEDWNYTVADYNVRNASPQGLAVTGDTLSRGAEMELFFSPVEGWDITMNVAKTYATRENLAGNMGDWLKNRWALNNEVYEGNDGSVWVNSAGQTVDAYAGGTFQGYTGLLTGGNRWFGAGSGSANAANARFGRNGYRFYSEFYSREGNNVPELRPWRANAVTSYRFKRGMLKGAFVGASFRWEDKSVVGYGVTEVTPERMAGATSLTAAVGKLDVDKPFYGPTESHWGVWVGYGRKVWRKVDWRVQLNANNVGEKNRLIPLTVNPDGSGAAYRIAEGMTWELKNTFKF